MPLGKAITVKPSDSPSLFLSLSQQFIQNSSGAKPKPKYHWPAPASHAEWAGWRALITKVPFLPSFLPLLLIPSRHPSFSFSLPPPPLLHARSQVTSGFLRSSPLQPSTHVKKQPAVSVPSLIIDAFCAPCSAGVGVNFHSAGDVNGWCNSDNQAPAVTLTLPCS